MSNDASEASDGSDRAGSDTSPSVGIFWGVPSAGRIVLVTDLVPLADAEPYGDCLTHPHGHYEVWEAWAALGAAGLRRLGLPAAIAEHEYETFPRGRVVYMRTPNLFTLYADKRLQRPDYIAELVRRFGLGTQRHVVRSDAHYRTMG